MDIACIEPSTRLRRKLKRGMFTSIIGQRAVYSTSYLCPVVIVVGQHVVYSWSVEDEAVNALWNPLSSGKRKPT
jgi:hypothetical protein